MTTVVAAVMAAVGRVAEAFLTVNGRWTWGGVDQDAGDADTGDTGDPARVGP